MNTQRFRAIVLMLALICFSIGALPAKAAVTDVQVVIQETATGTTVCTATPANRCDLVLSHLKEYQMTMSRQDGLPFPSGILTISMYTGRWNNLVWASGGSSLSCSTTAVSYTCTGSVLNMTYVGTPIASPGANQGKGEIPSQHSLGSFRYTTT